MSSTQYQTVESPVASYHEPHIGFAGSLTQAVSTTFAAVALWQERAAQRAHLAALGDQMLKDIGVTRVEADQEAAKPFWRG